MSDFSKQHGETNVTAQPRADNAHLKTLLAVLAFVSVMGWPMSARAAEPVRRGYVTEIPPEAPADREARHRRVAEKRKGPILMVHRGAAEFAPENTLEAFAAAMDHGADAVEAAMVSPITLCRRKRAATLCLRTFYFGIARLGQFTCFWLKMWSAAISVCSAARTVSIPIAPKT